jgi:hypothetical protein
MPIGTATQVRDRAATTIRFFTGRRHGWMIAARHSDCWHHVAWRRVCDRARRELHRQQAVYAAADQRVRSLMDVPAIIDAVFGPDGWKARAVAWCESRFSVFARNGQYRGIFQMGDHERATYGGSSFDKWEQIEAAHRYFLVAGWGPWQCA